MRALLDNPVLLRELRTRMTGRRAAVVLVFWLVFNGGVLALVYLGAENVAEQRFGFDGFASTVDIGRGIFEWTLFGMLLLVLFIVPAQAAGAIAGERERQTLVPMQVTLLGPGRILVGKLLASVAFLVLLIVAAVPLLAVGYLVGGIGLADVGAGTLAVLACGFALAAMCIAVSTFARRVQSATVLSYALVLALTLGTFVAYGAYAVVDQSRGSDRTDPPDSLLLPNPVALVSDVVGEFDGGQLPSPFDGVFSVVNERRDEFDVVAGGGGGAGLVFEDEFAPRRREPAGFRFWMASLGMLALGAVGSLGLAARRLHTPAETER